MELDEGLVTDVTALARAMSNAGSSHPLRMLAALAELRQVLDTIERQAVADARSGDAHNGVESWQAIADALGVARQTAHEKHGTTRPRPKEK